MSNRRDPEPDPQQPTTYEIRIRGHLDPSWSGWFPGLAVTPRANGDTILSGPVADQAALHGVLKKLRDLGLPLVSINQVEAEQTPRSDGDGGTS
jgi:hypothetical protein